MIQRAGRHAEMLLPWCVSSHVKFVRQSVSRSHVFEQTCEPSLLNVVHTVPTGHSRVEPASLQPREQKPPGALKQS